jgi:hypothetical protein
MLFRSWILDSLKILIDKLDDRICIFIYALPEDDERHFKLRRSHPICGHPEVPAVIKGYAQRPEFIPFTEHRMTLNT